MFHRCVVAVIGVLAISTSAAAGPIKFDAAPSFEAAELRSMDQKELRALFFRGGGARNAAASCADCLAANSRLRARDNDGKSASTRPRSLSLRPGCSRSPPPTSRRDVRPRAFRISSPDLLPRRMPSVPSRCRVARAPHPSPLSRQPQCRNRTPSRSSAQAWLEHRCSVGVGVPNRCSQRPLPPLSTVPSQSGTKTGSDPRERREPLGSRRSRYLSSE